MSENWPDTLPQVFIQSGYQETLPEVAIRTQMDAGPAKVRRRFTVQVVPIKGQMRLTSAQKSYLETFFNVTLAGGSLAFTFPHDGSVILRFTKPPAISPAGGLNYVADMDLEQLP